MDFLNASHAAAGWTTGFDRSGRELAIVIVKVTFRIPSHGEEPELAAEQVPLTEADQFTGEPGHSSIAYETDYAHHKPMCDVLLNASAYAPAGKMVTATQVRVQVGSMVKAFSVIGLREWRRGVIGVEPSSPKPFETMPISYDHAFGGVDDGGDEPGRVNTYMPNPVGRGFRPSKKDLAGRLLPNTEELGRPVRDPGGSYRPMSFGPVGRHWLPRLQYVGTYDEKWQRERKPFWPDDFDDRYFQAAPPDQQIPYPKGGEEVVLESLSPAGAVAFRLPAIEMPVWFIPYGAPAQRVVASVDTLLLEPDLGRFTMTWRAVRPMERSCFDMKQIIAGETSEEWQRAQRHGTKPYYKGLAEMVRARRGGR